MATLTPTKSNGAQSPATERFYVEPDREMRSATLAELLPDSVDSAFVANLMSAMLTHERCGVHLYRSVASRTTEPDARAKYEEFEEQTLRHVEILEQLIASAGGNPNYVSFHARAVEGTNSKILESTFALAGSIDVLTQEMSMLDAVFLAETIDHANWTTLAALTERLPAGDLRRAFEAAVDEVEAQEDEHLGWARDTRQQLVLQLATP
jgi:rubrerythrin